MIKAIIFDCFGVLVTDGWLPFKHEHFGHNPDKLERATELCHMVDNGLIAYEDFTKELAEMAQVDERTVNTALRGMLADSRLLDLVRKLKQQYKIGMLSNVAGDWLSDMFSQNDLKLFDAIALSYEMGVSKPDPRTYQVIAERLEVAPEHCLFIDDQPAYVAAAEEQGMLGTHYQGYDALVASLKKRGIKMGN